MLWYRTRYSDGNRQAEIVPFDEIGDGRFDLVFILLEFLPASPNNIREGGLIAQRMEISPIQAIHSRWPYIDLGRRNSYLIESIKHPLILASFF